MKLLPSAATALLLCTSLPSPAQTVRELDAHEHGAASLDIALDGDRLYIDLDTPADNVLGFEHAPSTDTGNETVEMARRFLESADPYVPTAAAGCSLESAEVSIELAAESDEEHGEDHDEGEHGHGEDHTGEEHAADGSDEDAHDSEGGTHSDIASSHVFVCASPDRLETLAVTLFDTFDGFEEIDAQLIGPGGQTAAELGAGRTTVSFESVR